MQRRNSRRNVLKGAAAASVGYWIGTQPARGQSKDKLNIACIGVGGKGESNILGVMRENVVALCDVDEKRAVKEIGRAHV